MHLIQFNFWHKEIPHSLTEKVLYVNNNKNVIINYINIHMCMQEQKNSGICDDVSTNCIEQSKNIGLVYTSVCLYSYMATLV